jgi:F-type H+-transporting ATPase subunit c
MNFDISGGLIIALGGLVPALAIGMIGARAVEAISRNPEASNRILPAMIMSMAFAEAIAIYSLILALMVVLDVN